MTIEHALAALPEHLDDVLSQLGPEKAAELTQLVGRLDQLGGDDRHTLSSISSLLRAGLPARHPVRRALVGGYLLAPSGISRATVAGVLRQRLGPGSGAADGTAEDRTAAGEPPTVSAILQAVMTRLLAAPAYSEGEVRQHGADPADPALIRLQQPGGGLQWPAFQFAPGPDGPRPVVRVINGMLGAAADPVGAADWWLSKNGWLGVPPSQLLGHGADQQLLSAARAVGSEV